MAFRLIDKEKYSEGFCEEILEEVFCELEKTNKKLPPVNKKGKNQSEAKKTFNI